jgi:hypothetical protein
LCIKYCAINFCESVSDVHFEFCVTGAARELHASAAEQTPAVARPALNFPTKLLVICSIPSSSNQNFSANFSAQVSRRVIYVNNPKVYLFMTYLREQNTLKDKILISPISHEDIHKTTQNLFCHETQILNTDDPHSC